MQSKILPLVILGSIYLAGCQKEVSDDTINSSDSTGIWVLAHKRVEGFESLIGNSHFVLNGGYSYDTASRTIVYIDTVAYDGFANPVTHQDVMSYDEDGRLVHISRTGSQSASSDVALFYNGDGLLEKFNAGYDVPLTWTRQGDNWVGRPHDPNPMGGPYTEYNNIYTLNAQRQLIAYTGVSIDTSVEDTYELVTRDANGDVTMRKIFAMNNGSLDFLDSFVYVRETAHPPRFSRFYELMGNGIQWFSNSYGITFLQMPSYFSEYYEYNNSLCNKKLWYATYTDDNGGLITEGPFEYNFVTEYDANDNPVKQTISFLGEKVAEISFTWTKIKWVN